ncbi:polyprenyl synthetase family protein [Streptomyces alkaliterrae]|uniref:Polyprenyl synthetase family protein n=1 Tax=Streptomyces alkaliterrae TaxID=2213162 RepID=A0A7W3X040_9ACTN|nr:polyprenyl synthetase family protein [Streptomyces alkaliterrae]MBB1261651.1 polyprenyl synthetase family protein [Streptomyces alkaliterrae]
MKQTPAVAASPYSSDEALTLVQKRLEGDLARVRERLHSLVAPPHSRIAGPIEYAVAQTGRLLRPTLVLLSAYLLEEDAADTPQRVVDAAAVVETLHVATLYHDDLIDDARTRRGRPTANAKYGDTLALLTGDYLLARCMEAAAAVNAAPVMARTLTDVCVGQMLESSQLYDPLRSEDDYLAAISGKTARLIRTAALMGALQSNADNIGQEALEGFGHHLGMAFQIWDDILDICSEETGKQVAKDLHNGVYTLPVIYAARTHPDEMLPILRERPMSEEQRQRVISLTHRSGALGRAADVARDHVRDAMGALRSHPSFAERAPVVGRYLHGVVDRFASQHPALRGPLDATRADLLPVPAGMEPGGAA